MAIVTIEIYCGDCKADLGYGDYLNGEKIEKCKHCGSDNIKEYCEYDD